MAGVKAVLIVAVQPGNSMYVLTWDSEGIPLPEGFLPEGSVHTGGSDLSDWLDAGWRIVTASGLNTPSRRDDGTGKYDDLFVLPVFTMVVERDLPAPSALE